jgi:hypothetical protein
MSFLKHQSVKYYQIDNYIEVILKSGNDTVDKQSFDINSEKGQRRFFNYVVEKLGINFKKFQKEKDTEYY